MTLKISNKSLGIIYSTVLAWLPFLSIYRSFVPGMSIAELILVICALLSIVFHGESNRHIFLGKKTLCMFSIYSFLITVISILIGEWFDITWFHRVIRFMTYIFCILYTSRDMFLERYYFRHVNVVSWLVFLGIVFQYFAYYTTGRYYKLYGNILPLMTNELLNVNFDLIFSYSVFRPSSFLTEPSHIAQFAMIPFTFNLYKYNMGKDWKNLVTSIIIGITILLSKSLWGYFLLILIVSFWLLDTSKKKQSASWYILVPIILIVGVNSLLNSKLWADTFSRLDISNLQGSLAFSGRFTGYEDFFQLQVLRIIFGSGFGAIINKQITNSILFVLVGEGVVGLLLLAITLINVLVRTKEKWRRTLCVAFSILLFGSNIFFSLSIVTIFSILFNDDSADEYIG